VRRAGREIGRGALGAFRVGEDIRLVRPLVDRRTPQFREPYWFRTRDPGGGRPLTDAADTVVMGIAPPAHEVLEAPHPGLAIGAIADRRADIGDPVGSRGVVPVEALAAGNIGAQIGGIVDAVS